MKAIDDVACSKPGCDNFGQPGVNLVSHGWFTTKSGRRQRYRCKRCHATLSTNTGTAYSGLRCSRKAFDQVASLRVEGVSLSATARVSGHSRNTIARWLERASMAAERFNRHMLRDFPILELQADELFTFVGSSVEPSGCLRSSKCRRASGPGAASAAARIGRPRPSSTTSSSEVA